uniref:Uncharacterized protein TCIL3000_3_2170 n=1 Tax=Trypanosoma congolense (strain IL3000) TaxID=1068625 RepID=G0UK80_TRYCI|nr:unnamed protein product [Trypanosoma congolense IL3000]
MFYTRRVSQTALAHHQPILDLSVSSRVTVNRLLGIWGKPTINLSVINAIVSKTKGEGVAGYAGKIGKAMYYFQRRNNEAAITEIDDVFFHISDEALRRLALGIRLRAKSELLHLKESASRVFGGATELEMTEIRNSLRDDYKMLESISCGCWLAHLAAAEYCLYEGNAEKAYHSFCTIEKTIEGCIAQCARSIFSSQGFHNTDSHVSLFLAFQLGRFQADGRLKVSSRNVEKIIKGMKGDHYTERLISSFKKDIHANLTNEEAIELAYVFEAAHARHHFHDYFPRTGEYRNWNSERVDKIQKNIENVYVPNSVSLRYEVLDRIKEAVPRQPFYASEESVRKILSVVSTDVITDLKKAFGPSPKAPLVQSEDDYYDILRNIEEGAVSADAAGASEYPAIQAKLCCQLLQQLLYRVRVNRAVALTQLDCPESAVKLSDGVIDSDEYIYMWRAYLARAEANKRLGYISKSNEDFRQLFDLRRETRANV